MLDTNITYTNTSSKEHYKGITYSNPLFRGYFLPRSYNLTGLPLKMLQVSNCMLEEDNHIGL
jgi:hypothetical protein